MPTYTIIIFRTVVVSVNSVKKILAADDEKTSSTTVASALSAACSRHTVQITLARRRLMSASPYIVWRMTERPLTGAILRV